MQMCIGEDLENAGQDCWNHCYGEQGPCSWCGSNGMCCTTKSEWTDTTNGCDGTFGGSAFHACTLKPGTIPPSLIFISSLHIYQHIHLYI